MKMLQLDRVAIWKPKLLDELTIREAGAGRNFVKNQIISKTTQKSFRYAKNYEVGKTKFCLFVISYSDSKVAIEQFLDECAKGIDEGIAQKVVMNATDTEFEWTDFYYKED